MQAYTNSTGVPLSIAVYLATDHYDYIPGTISATGLIKPLRQIILKRRVPKEEQVTDVLNLIKSRMGTSVHDGVEKAWTGHYKRAMASLGYPDEVINRIIVNSEELLRARGYNVERLRKEGTYLTPGPVPENHIPVFMEVRQIKEFMGKLVTGKFDFCAEGRVEDVKNTSVYTWVKGSKDQDYQLQGSIYRWLNPELIFEDTMLIQFFFSDWKAFEAKQNQNYPKRQTEQRIIPLLDITDTEAYVHDKLSMIEHYSDHPESDLPKCSDDDLWRDPPVWKYYRDPNKTKRATKNFDDPGAAHQYMVDKGGVGVVREFPGQVKACLYCDAFSVCRQKDELIADGSLQLQ